MGHTGVENLMPSTKPEERLSIRASEAQKDLLRRAAASRHMNVSQFVLQTSLRAAEDTLAEESTCTISREHHEWLTRALDSDPIDTSALRALMSESSSWDA